MTPSYPQKNHQVAKGKTLAAWAAGLGEKHPRPSPGTLGVATRRQVGRTAGSGPTARRRGAQGSAFGRWRRRRPDWTPLRFARSSGLGLILIWPLALGGPNV